MTYVRNWCRTILFKESLTPPSLPPPPPTNRQQPAPPLLSPPPPFPHPCTLLVHRLFSSISAIHTLQNNAYRAFILFQHFTLDRILGVTLLPCSECTTGKATTPVHSVCPCRGVDIHIYMHTHPHAWLV